VGFEPQARRKATLIKKSWLHQQLGIQDALIARSQSHRGRESEIVKKFDSLLEVAKGGDAGGRQETRF
jgi:hypothetical protein